MSDLEQQAASWVPPWQRPAGSATSPADDRPAGELDSADEAGDATPDGALDGGTDAMVDQADDGSESAAPSEAAGQRSVGGGEGGGESSEGDVLAAGQTGQQPGKRARAGKGRGAVRTDAVVDLLAAAVPGQRGPADGESSPLIVDDRPPLPAIPEGELVPALEAILMVVDEPVSEILLSQVLDIEAERLANTLIDMSATYTREGRGFDLRRAAGGWRIYTRADYATYVERFVLDGQQLRLTQASLETLAVVAYKQPVTRSRISAIRGVNCDGVIRTLVTRGMVEECGADPESGAHLYRTTILFLEKMGLDSVAELPPLAPFLPDNLEEIANGE